jgi:DNA primase
MRQLPGHYVLSKFYTYAGDPVFRKFDGNYNASCPICREGKSWLRKKRLYFYPTTNTFYCFNCNKSWNAVNWIIELSGLSKDEIELDAFSGDLSLDVTKKSEFTRQPRKEKPSLPYDSINLLDSLQVNYYKNNIHFNKALEYIKSRRLHEAVNKSSSYYISLTDILHKNRLCVPYRDYNNQIIFYQTRSLDGSEPRYLNKIGYDKSIFNINQINPNLDKIFLFEGPMDCVFVQNGVAVAGLNLTALQEKQINKFPFHDKIWILDNPKKDQASKEKIQALLTAKQKVFRWPLSSPYKDFNEWVVAEGINEIPYDFILKSLYLI